MRFPVLAATVDRDGPHLGIDFKRRGAVHLDGDTWTFVPVLPGRPDLTALAAHTSDDGRVWLAYPDSLAVVDGGATRLFPASEIGVGALRTIGGRAGLLWVGGETGWPCSAETASWRCVRAEARHRSDSWSAAWWLLRSTASG